MICILQRARCSSDGVYHPSADLLLKAPYGCVYVYAHLSPIANNHRVDLLHQFSPTLEYAAKSVASKQVAPIFICVSVVHTAQLCVLRNLLPSRFIPKLR